jgi:hypothetical protein
MTPKQIDEHIRRRNRAARAARPRENLWHSARKRAAEKGVPFTIKPSDTELVTHCPVRGIALHYGASQEHLHEYGYAASLDRVIPELGYVPGNVRVISFRANDQKQCVHARD